MSEFDLFKIARQSCDNSMYFVGDFFDTSTGSGCWPIPYDITPAPDPFDGWKKHTEPHIVTIYETKELKEEKHPMENIYHVMVVTLDREIILDEKVVAEDLDDAKFNAKVFGKLEEKKLKPRDVTIVVREIGQVKIRKEVKKVKVVDKE